MTLSEAREWKAECDAQMAVDRWWHAHTAYWRRLRYETAKLVIRLHDGAE